MARMTIIDIIESVRLPHSKGINTICFLSGGFPDFRADTRSCKLTDAYDNGTSAMNVRPNVGGEGFFLFV